VLLDRDGVLNRALMRDGKGYAPRDPAQFHLHPDAARALARLARAGFRLAVATNQPDLGNGLVAPRAVAAMHRRLARLLPVELIALCPHRQDAGCACRKPRPGMLLAAARALGLDLARSVMIGDRRSDVLAGQAVGCYTIFLDRGYREPKPERPDFTARSLDAAARWILRTRPDGRPAEGSR
jgi:D-glycero-D-manno-heptose 1,7-bisphosphate phosphatase